MTIDLRRARGPYVPTSDGRWLVDATSDDGHCVLGYNAAALFGAAEYAECWSGDCSTATMRQVRKALADLIQRKLGWPTLHAQFTASGEEALALALENCISRVADPRADRVIAIGGQAGIARSRLTQVTIPYPTLPNDDVLAPSVPSGWLALWGEIESASHARCDWASMRAHDGVLDRECRVLEQVQAELAGRGVVAVVIPPMLADDGDEYSSARFHVGLAAICHRMTVPLIDDERRTAPGLGRTFFWHALFGSSNQESLGPDLVICGARAQVGMVLARRPMNGRDTVRSFLQLRCQLGRDLRPIAPRRARRIRNRGPRRGRPD